MELSNIRPFIRYIHYLTITADENRAVTIPYDNRLFYMYRGTGEIKISGLIYHVEENDVLIIPSGTEYQLLPSEKDYTYIGVNFDYTQAHSDKQIPIPPAETKIYNSALKLESINFIDVHKLNEIVHIKHINRIGGKLVQMEREYTNKLLYFESIISNLLSEILLECTRILSQSNNDKNRELTHSIIRYIQENYSKPLSNETIGRAFSLHPNYINGIIKASTGMSLHQYLIHTRVSYSVELLIGNRHSISEISELCGFCDVYHYSKVFKKIMGIAPSKYI